MVCCFCCCVADTTTMTKNFLLRFHQPLLQNHDKDNKRSKTSSEDNKIEDTGSQQRQNVSSFGSNTRRFCEKYLPSWKKIDFDSNKIETRRGQALAISCCCFLSSFPCLQQEFPLPYKYLYIYMGKYGKLKKPQKINFPFILELKTHWMPHAYFFLPTNYFKFLYVCF